MKKITLAESPKKEMQISSKIVRYIQQLSAKDRERFYLFVSSPYFNQHDKTRELLDLILEKIENVGQILDREKIYKRLFPREAFDEQKLHNVMSYLKKLYNRFLAQQHYEKQPFREQLYTLEAAYDMNALDILLNRAKVLEKAFEQQSYQDNNFHYTNYRFHTKLGYYSSVDRSKSQTLQKMMDHLDRFYLIEKLRNGCHLIANMMLVNTTYDLGFFEDLMAYFQKNIQHYEKDASVILYYTIYMSLTDSNDSQYYDAMKTMLANKMHQFSTDERHDLYSFASNYCILQIHLGQSQYQRELFQLYQQGLTTELLLNNNIISEWNYKNIATLGCSLKEFDWTEQFIQNYRDALPPNRRENAYNFNLANLYYNQKKYNEALTALMQVQFTDVKHHLNTNMLLLRTYFALRDTEALLSLIETFRIYIIRNRKLTTAEKKGFTNFLRFSKNLVLLKHHASTFSRKTLEEKLQALRQKIDTTQNVINKYWLLEECV